MASAYWQMIGPDEARVMLADGVFLRLDGWGKAIKGSHPMIDLDYQVVLGGYDADFARTTLPRSLSLEAAMLQAEGWASAWIDDLRRGMDAVLQRR